MEDTEEIFASYHLYICIITLYLCGSIASAGGIGGGGVNVPLLLVMGGYEYHEAVVFSLCTVLGNHLAQSTINWPVSHPYVKQRPLIYWDLILFLLPAQLGGSNLGVVISKAPPDILMLICAFFVLILAIAKTYHKGMMYYREERKSDSVSKYQKLANYAADCESESRNQSLLSGSLVQGSMIDQQHQQEGLSPLLSAVEEEDPAQLSVLSAKDFDFTVTENFTGDKATLEEESVQNVLYQATEEARREDQTVPSASSSSTSSVLLSVGAKQHPHLSLLPPSPPSPPHHNNLISSTTSTPLSSDPRKASTAQNHRVVYRILPYRILQILFLVFLIYVAFFLLLSYTVESCSLEYYLLLAGLYPFLIGFIYWARGFALYRQHHEPYYEVVKGDVKMEDQAIVLISLIFGVGVLSSLLGIGGGELMGPLFLTYHLLPPVSTATTSMMSLISTANNIIHYAIDGDINYAVGVVFFFTGLAAGATGRYTALHLVNKYQKNSILVFMLLTILTISASLVVYEIVTEDHDFSFHALCE